MIGTILKVTALNLARDRVALLLTFVLPLLFFSVFAAVFAGVDEAASRPVRVLLAVEGHGPFVTGIAAELASEPRLRVTEVDRAAALDAVRRGKAQVAVVLPSGLRPTLPGSTTAGPPVELVADRSNPLAIEVVRGLVQGAALAAGSRLASPSSGAQRASAAEVLPLVVVDAVGDPGRRPSVAFFAAGLGVMFLMFAVAGRSSILLDERESGILQRMLAAEVGLSRLLLGRWLSLVIVGVLQVTVMFVWAALGFGLELFTPRHLAGFAVVTAATAAAAAGFGLVLSSACRTRAQLNGVSVVVILVFAAVGGNLFPSFLMPEGLREAGRLTFNAWALSGYQKVFWYDLPVTSLAVELAVLVGWTAVFLVAARLLARRWERL
jgi:ABC-2 type transport system permease protein